MDQEKIKYQAAQRIKSNKLDYEDLGIMALQAVYFDIGGTIETFRSSPEIRRESTPRFRALLEKAGVHLEMDDDGLLELLTTGVKRYHKWNRQSLIELPTAEIWSQVVLKDLNLPIEQIAPISEDLAFLYETGFFIREMRPEAPQVLESIQQMGLRIGCISNTQSLTQVPYSLKRYGIQQYFDPLVLSSQLGHRKPDPAVFYHAARLASLPTSQVIYVGDKINRDVLGSSRSGYCMSIKINHVYDDGDPDLGATPDAVIENLYELLPLIEDILKRDRKVKPVERKIKAIFFDAGNILYTKPRKGRHIKQFLARHKLKSQVDVKTEKRKLKDLAFNGEIDRFEFYERVIRLYGVTEPAVLQEGVDALLKDATTVEIVDGVPETIKALKKRGYILGIISDTATPIKVKLDWFAEAGFGNEFDTFISSKELGTRKPAAVIYKEACRSVGLSVDGAVFVGHKASELKGARSVGLKTIAFKYDKNARADVYIEKFGDLLNVPLLG